jgi:hypothetical protein
MSSSSIFSLDKNLSVSFLIKLLNNKREIKLGIAIKALAMSENPQTMFKVLIEQIKKNKTQKIRKIKILLTPNKYSNAFSP